MIRLNIKRKTVIIILFCYISCILYMLFVSPFFGRGTNNRVLQFIPLKTLLDQFKFSYGVDIFIGNIIGNLMLLFPIGLIISILNINIHFKRKILYFLLLATLIELTQFIFAVGCMDIDDIWMNGIGGYYGYYFGEKISSPS